jgi:hypothetical protein
MRAHKKSKRPRIGDVIEIETPAGLAYAQLSHQNKQFGHLIRVLPGIYQQPLETFADVVNLKERFYVFFPLSAALSQGIVKCVSNEGVPIWARKFPLMRKAGWRDDAGKVLNWWLWDGNEEWQVDSLTPEQENLSLAQIWNDTLLVQRIVEGWSPGKSLSDQSAGQKVNQDGASSTEKDQAVIDKLHTVGLNLKHPHYIKHYLYFPSKLAANKAAKMLEVEGYTVKVIRASDGLTWLALAAHQLLPTNEVITGVRSHLEWLAATMQGEYDGWEVEIAK